MVGSRQATRRLLGHLLLAAGAATCAGCSAADEPEPGEDSTDEVAEATSRSRTRKCKGKTEEKGACERPRKQRKSTSVDGGEQDDPKADDDKDGGDKDGGDKDDGDDKADDDKDGGDKDGGDKDDGDKDGGDKDGGDKDDGDDKDGGDKDGGDKDGGDKDDDDKDDDDKDGGDKDDGDNHKGSDLVVPPDSQPLGASYGEWGARYWERMLSIPFDRNPLFDATGEDCGEGDSGQVWFLAGTPSGTAHRTCAIPADTYVLVPILGTANDYPCPDPAFRPPAGLSLEQFLTDGAHASLTASALHLKIDGKRIGELFDYEATSALFTFTGDPSLRTRFDPCITGSPQAAVAYGFWVMVRPLRAGSHTIRFGGEGTLYGWPFSSGASYALTVGK